MLTYQDYISSGDVAAFCNSLLAEYRAGALYATALDADAYDHRRNTTINNFVQKLYSANGRETVNFVAANNRLTSNFFRRLNVQRNMYSLGNGLTFPDEAVKAKLGGSFDTELSKAGYAALIHGVSYLFWNYDRAYCFRATEFAPLYDEVTGALRAGLRFWQLDDGKPVQAVFYSPDGYTRLTGDSTGSLSITQNRVAYKLRVATTKAGGEEILGGDNYDGRLPVVPLYGSSLKQSTLVGMKQSIDAYDIINSGFANDLSDCAQIYWIVKNAGGMSDDDLDRLRTKMLLMHIIPVDTDAGAGVEAHQAEIPYSAREACLERLKAGIYEDFGGLDVHTVSADSTNDHLDAAYQPMDENADDYEYCIIECVTRLLALIGVTGDGAIPLFKRNRICNVREQAEIVMLEAPYLDDETILSKLPNITPDEIKSILAKKDADELSRYSAGTGGDDGNDDSGE